MPGFVCAVSVVCLSAQWEGSLSELWVWAGVFYCKVKPSVGHRAPLLGLSWLWHDQLSDFGLAP